jgi:hypothetical protein
MTTNHNDFELLCVLASSGDLKSEERVDLSAHLEGCAFCRERLLEMRQLSEQLVLAQARKGPRRRLPKGMKDRFLVRAVREGIPLSPPRPGTESHALGMATALLLVLLLVAATLRTGPFRTPGAVTYVAEPPAVSRWPEPERKRQIGAGNKVTKTEMSHTQLRMLRHRPHAHAAAFAVSLPAFEGRQFRFNFFAQSAVSRGYRYSMPIRLPEPGPGPEYPGLMPQLTLDATSEVFQHLAPRLLAYGPTGLDGVQPAAGSDPSRGQNFRLLKVGYTDGYRILQIPAGVSR